jgi:uncharacterized LabA/DUF88 family protein
MPDHRDTYAFIDGQNLHLGIQSLGWALDYRRFRRYLQDKYGVTKAFYFIGYRRENEKLYVFLRESGYYCVFKPTLELPNGEVKGNVDAELVLHCMVEYPNYRKALIVSGDGDFRCLAEYLLTKDKLERILIPNRLRYSGLLKSLSSTGRNILAFVGDNKDKLERR